MRGTFSNNVLMNADLSKWDTSAATTMYSMFIGCSVMNVDLSKWYEGVRGGARKQREGQKGEEREGWERESRSERERQCERSSFSSSLFFPRLVPSLIPLLIPLFIPLLIPLLSISSFFSFLSPHSSPFYLLIPLGVSSILLVLFPRRSPPLFIRASSFLFLFTKRDTSSVVDMAHLFSEATVMNR